ncbi:MAG: hypothetical protein AAGI67_00600 [Pseudomonadota bacterium]
MRRTGLALALLGGTVAVQAQVDNLRITEVDPATGEVEVTNVGDEFTTSVNRPFCHRFVYQNNIPANTLFGAGGIQTFSLNNLDASASDLWIYRSSPFGSAANLIQGLQYGAPVSGRAGLASGDDKWSGADSVAPVPPSGMTLSWDGFGNTAFDWYVDETPSLGSAEMETPGTIPPSTAFPAGVQDFESLLLGDTVSVIQNWPVVDSSPTGAFTIRTVSDVLGTTTPRSMDSSQWLRIHDADPGDVQNRFYGPTIEAVVESNYEWRFFNAVEAPPPASGDNYPRYTIQHIDGGFANTWGIEYRNDGVYLVVIGSGGTPASTLIQASTYPDDLGVWQEVSLMVDFGMDTVSASIDGQTPVSLPINLAATADATRFRFCYRGEGVGNVGTFLLDDVSVAVDDPRLIFANGFEE